MPKTSKSVRIAIDTQLSAGLEENYPEDATFLIATKSVSVADLLALLRGRLDAMRASDAAYAAWIAAVNLGAERRAASEKILTALRQLLRTHHGVDSPTLVDFGLTPRKAARVLTVDEKKIAAEKRLATRQARHTMGPRQRSAIIGTLTPAPAPTPMNGAAPQAGST